MTAMIHPQAVVESDAVGAGTRIWAFTHVLPGATIGADCNVGEQCYVESGARIGDRVTVKNGVSIWDGVTIDDGVFVGPGVLFTNDRRPRSPRLAEAGERYADDSWLVPTRIERGATLGAGAVILPGLSIGEYAFVGAGAVVTRDVPAHALVLGNPAAVRGWVCRCGETLSFGLADATCQRCHSEYRRDGSELKAASL